MITEKEIICQDGDIYIDTNYCGNINIEIHDIDDDVLNITLIPDELNKLIRALEFYTK